MKEKIKVPISNKEMDIKYKGGEILTINELQGIRYATPKNLIILALKNKKFPVIDWPISKIDIILKKFPEQTYVVYIFPPTIESLKKRLDKDGRDPQGIRFHDALKELKECRNSKYSKIFNIEIVSDENKIPEIAHKIYESYIKFIGDG